MLLFVTSIMFISLTFLSPLSGIAGAKVLYIKSDTTSVMVGPYIEILEDKSKNLNITEVSAPPFSDRFQANETSSINQGITDSAYWYRFSLTTKEGGDGDRKVGFQPVSSEWYLFLGRQLDFYDEVKIFWQQAEDYPARDSVTWQERTFGMYGAIKKGKRDPTSIKIILPQKASEPLTLYMRVKAEPGFFLKPTLYSPEAYNTFTSKLALFYGAYYGIVLSLIIYNLFHFFFLRDKVRLIFILYAATLGAYFLVANELSLTLFPTSFLIGLRKAAQLLALISIAQIVYFSIVFLDAKRTIPVFHRLLQLNVCFSLGLIILLPFFSYYEIGDYILNFSTLNVLLILSAGITAWIKGYKPARFFVVAWFFFLGGGLVYVFNFKGIFPFAFVGNNAYQAGSGIEMLLLSMAIADRVSFLFKKLGEAQTKREQQLNALTQQLIRVEESERKRIAGILHDSIGQTLCATKWEVRRILNMTECSEKSESRALSYIESCINETRFLTANLYPRVLYEFGLGAALQSLAEEYSDRFDLKVRVKVEGEPENVGDEINLLLYRTVSELLTNVVKHAQAEHAKIQFSARESHVAVSVIDDGIGFSYPEDTVPEITGFGLFSIQERVSNAGGSVRIEKPVPGGSRVTVSVPVK